MTYDKSRALTGKSVITIDLKVLSDLTKVEKVVIRLRIGSPSLNPLIWTVQIKESKKG